MLELYVWNPRNKNKKDIHGSLKGIAKAVVQGGNVGAYEPGGDAL